MAKRKSAIGTRELELIMEKLPDFPSYVEKYIHHKKSNRSAQTLSSYLIDFRHFFEWLQEYADYNDKVKNIPLSLLENLPLSFSDSRR